MPSHSSFYPEKPSPAHMGRSLPPDCLSRPEQHSPAHRSRRPSPAPTACPAQPVGCVYMPHFAAWAAGEPRGERDAVIVHARERIFSASPAFLDQGLQVGLSLHRARMLFPHACFLPRDLPAEQIYADRLLNHLYQLTPQVALIEDRHLTGWWAAVQGFAAKDLQTVLQKFHARGGRAAPQSYAMIAALYAPQGKLHTFSTPKESFHNAPIQPLVELGISPQALELLHWVGVKTLADLYRLTQQHLQAQFGKEGRRLFMLLHPPPQSAGVPHYTPRSVTVTRTISWTLRASQDFHPHLIALIRTACERIPASVPTWLRLQITQRGGTVVERSRALKPPFGRNTAVQGPARYLLDQGLAALHEEQPVRQLELTLGGLIPADPVQGSLFPARPRWGTARQHLLRRFPHRLFQPVRNTDAPFLPEEEFSLRALTE